MPLSEITLDGRPLVLAQHLVKERKDLFATGSKLFAKHPRMFSAQLPRTSYEYVYRGQIVPETHRTASIYIYRDRVAELDVASIQESAHDKRKSPAVNAPISVESTKIGPAKDDLPGMRMLSMGDLTIQFRADGYINATKMCKDGGKEWKNYYQNESSKALIASLERWAGIPADLLISAICTGPNHLRGTFVHPDIAINLAQWISPDFAIAVSQLVRRYASGNITTEESQAMAAAIDDAIKPVPHQPDETQDAVAPSTETINDHTAPDAEQVWRWKYEILDLQSQLKINGLESKLEINGLEAKLMVNGLESKVALGDLNQQIVLGQMELQRVQFDLARAKADQQADRRSALNELKFREAKHSHRLSIMRAQHAQAMTQQKLDFLIALWHLKTK